MEEARVDGELETGGMMEEGKEEEVGDICRRRRGEEEGEREEGLSLEE